MNYFDDNEDRIVYGRRCNEDLDDPAPIRCKHCGSTDVRWRQQGGAWVLFSLTPGIVHECASDDLAKDFD